MPFGVNLMRSQVLYWAAQESSAKPVYLDKHVFFFCIWHKEQGNKGCHHCTHDTSYGLP